MQAIRRWAGALALASCLLVPPVATAAAISNLIVFGDSLSDPGNAAALTLLNPPPAPADPVKSFFPPSPSGRFTNGPTAAEYLAGLYGVPVVNGWPTAAGANNMAVGGALTGNGNFNYIINSPAGLQTNPAYATVGVTGTAEQIAAYKLANPAGLADPNALTLLWAGPNDFFLGFTQAEAGIPVDFAAVTAQAVFNMADNIVALATGGAKNILIPNMPDLGKTPALAGTPAAPGASQISAAYNFGLAQAIAQAATDLGPLGVRLYTADTAALLLAAIKDPARFGFTNATEGCIDSLAAIQSNCEGYVFFDGVHPTTAAHALLAAEFAAAVPEPSTYALMALGLLALLVASRRRRT